MDHAGDVSATLQAEPFGPRRGNPALQNHGIPSILNREIAAIRHSVVQESADPLA